MCQLAVKREMMGVLLRRGNLIGAVCLVVVTIAPEWGWAQAAIRPPHGVRRGAPRPVTHASSSSSDAEAVAADTPAGAPSEAANVHASPAVDEGGSYPGYAVEAAAGEGGPTGWYATHPNPDEPLGFSGAMMTLAAPEDPRANPGILEEPYPPYEPIQQPFDLDAPAPAVSSGEWVRDGFWYTQQSAVYMSRSVSVKNSVILAFDLGAVLLPHNNFFLQIPLDMGFEPGLRSMIGRRIGRDCRNRDHSVEFTFLGLTHWQTGGGLDSITGAGLFTPIDPTDVSAPVYNGSSQQTFDQVSDFNSYEWNYRIDRRLARDKLVYTRDSTWVRQADPALLPSVYAGVRYVSINETLLWLAQSVGAEAGTGSYLVTTHNNMVGPQIGGDLFYERTDWRLGIRTRAAAVVNWNSQRSTVRILNNNGVPLVPNRDESVDTHDAAFVGEIGFVGSYHFRPNFALRASYDLMWVTNLALAQNQLTFNPALPAEISNSHSLFYQGLSLGFEIVR
jgi:hypothetical protein